jgi:hypothetical protein
MNTAKAWKLFDGDRAGDTSNDWHTWVAEEGKKRYFVTVAPLMIDLRSLCG